MIILMRGAGEVEETRNADAGFRYNNVGCPGVGMQYHVAHTIADDSVRVSGSIFK